MNPLYTTAAASPMCRRLAATATATVSSTTATSSSIGRIASGVSTVRNAGHVSKVALKAKELETARAAAAATAAASGSSSAKGLGLPGSADRMMAAQLARLGRELTPAEKQKYALRLVKMKMSRKQFMKWQKANPQNPVSIPNLKAVLPEGHGENIWLWNHVEAGHVVYSFHPAMDSNKALAQFPYTGKKNVPAKLRRDYWRPFAQIQFPAGQGAVGRSVWQKLLELKKRHELEWGHQKHEFLHMKREDRGRAINDQRANVVADIAAVLGGAGKGNLVVKQQGEGEDGGEDKLCPATVYWANSQDRHYASEWPANVRHFLGLPKFSRTGSVDMDAGAEAEVVDEEGKGGEDGGESGEGKPPGGGGVRRGEDEAIKVQSQGASPAAIMEGMTPAPIPVRV